MEPMPFLTGAITSRHGEPGRHARPVFLLMTSTTPLKLCIVTPCHWAALFGGAEYQIRCLLDVMLRERSFDIHYLARHLKPGFTPEGYSTHHVGRNGSRPHYNQIFDAARIHATLKKLQPDVIYQRVGGAYTGISALYARQTGCRMVWHVSSDKDVTPFRPEMSKDIALRYLEKLSLEYGVRNSSDIIVQTEQQADALARHYQREATAIIANFHPDPAPQIDKKGEIEIVWIANFKPLKQPELFVRLAREMDTVPGVRFTMIGRCGAKRRRQLEKESSAIQSLNYIGSHSFDEINRILSKAHILVNTSRYEGFPNTFIQAWQNEVPVVSLNVNPDNVLTKHGIGFPCANDFEQLVRKVRLLVKNEELRTSMGRKARRYALEHHSEKNAERIIHLIEEGAAHE